MTAQMVDLHLCVNDENGNLTDTVFMLDVSIDGDTLMHIELDLDEGLNFSETSTGITIGRLTMPIGSKGTMVGNVFWNSYEIAVQSLVEVLNMLEAEATAVLTEAVDPLFQQWEMAETFSVNDFVEFFTGPSIDSSAIPQL